MKKIIMAMVATVAVIGTLPTASQAKDASEMSGASSVWSGGYTTHREDRSMRMHDATEGDVAESKTYKKSRFVAAGLAFFLGGIGAHSFYMGHTWTGVIRLTAALISCGFAEAVLIPISLIEACIYLFSSDEEFNQKYIIEGRSWF